MVYSATFHNGNPAVNIKCYKGLDDLTYPLNLGRYSEDGGKTWKDLHTDAGFDWEWIRGRIKDDQELYDWYTLTAEDVLGQLIEEAVNMFQEAGYCVEIHQSGRSGGWLEVMGLEEFEDWSPDLIEAWRKFEKMTEETVEGFPYSMAVNIYINVWEAEQIAEQQREQEIDATWKELEDHLIASQGLYRSHQLIEKLKEACPRLVKLVEG